MTWRIYFFFYSILLGLSYWAGWGERWLVYEYLEIPMQIILLTGLYGYAFKKIIWGAGFWRKYLPIIICWDLVGLLIDYEPSQDNEAAALMGIVIFILCLITIPAYMAVYFYGHKSEELWNPQPAPPQ
jgi:hypothetical protein